LTPAPADGLPDAVAQALGALDWRQALGGADRILLKPNLGWDLPIPGSVTSPAVLSAVVHFFVDHGLKITIIEADQVVVDVEVAARHAGVPELARLPGVSWLNLTQQPTRIHRLAGARVLHEVALPVVLDEAPLVTLPVMKTHSKTTMSGAIKNQWGLLPLDRYRWHPVVHDALVDLLALAPPALCILDATVALEGKGPKSGTPRRVDHLMASTHAGVMDWVSSVCMGIDPQEVAHVRDCVPEGFAGWESVELVGQRPDWEPFLRADHNMVSGLEEWFHESKLKGLVFDSPLFDVCCFGARMYYEGWYRLGPGRTRRER